MSRPVIGITTDHVRDRTRYELGYGYVQAVVAAGGEPIVLPFYEGAALPAFVEGLLLTGGNDPDPAAWGEAWHAACNPVDPVRECHERKLVDEAQRRGLPVLGICFGMQIMNLARGGSLIQHLPDLPDRHDHTRGEGGWEKRHDIQPVAGSRFARITGGDAPLSVNTSHHQAVGRVGKGLEAVAVAADGTIEAIEDGSRSFWIGVQWHAERMTGDPRQQALFSALVEAAAQGARG